MNSRTLKALGRNIAYHQEMAKLTQDAKLAATHADAAAQLKAVVDAEPTMSAIDIAMAKQPVTRAIN